MESVARAVPHPRARLAAAAVLVAFGVAWLYWAWRCDVTYAARHFLPEYAVVTAHDRMVARTWRVVGGSIGLASMIAAPFVGRWFGRHGLAEGLATAARMGVAVVLALVAAEIGLRALHLPNYGDGSQLTQIRIGQPDPRYGWLYVASRATVLHHGGRDVEYAIDAEHDRAPTPTTPVDFDRPSILFAGESITAGHGLDWKETYPAIVADALGVQPVNLGVHGYGVDQAFLRLHDELPRFHHPVAVVSIFILPMLARVDEDTHARLVMDGVEPRLVPWDGLFHDLRVARVWRLAVPYRGDGAIELTKTLLRETDRLARARGAEPLFVAPRFSRERVDAYLFDELFVKQGLDVVDVDFGFQPLPDDDNHPDAASVRRLSDAIVTALRRELASR